MGVWHSAKCTQEEHRVFYILERQGIVILVTLCQTSEIVLIADKLMENSTYPISVV